jgi:hypothetical protein
MRAKASRKRLVLQPRQSFLSPQATNTHTHTHDQVKGFEDTGIRHKANDVLFWSGRQILRSRQAGTLPLTTTHSSSSSWRMCLKRTRQRRQRPRKQELWHTRPSSLTLPWQRCAHSPHTLYTMCVAVCTAARAKRTRSSASEMGPPPSRGKDAVRLFGGSLSCGLLANTLASVAV